MSTLTPRGIVAELDKFVVGQEQAKRMVAVAVRNRWRRQHLAPELRDEVSPKNIIMMGPTGVGKTEIARRLAEWKNPAPDPNGGYAQLFHEHVEGADTGADFDFLKGCRGREVGKDSH